MHTQLFRIRFLLRAKSIARLHAMHAPTIYALLSESYGVANRMEPVMPDGLLLDVPEQCRVHLARDSTFAFGMTLLSGSELEAGQTLWQLTEGLRSVGRKKPKHRRLALAGKFDIAQVKDLVSGKRIGGPSRLQPIDTKMVERELVKVRDAEALTLRFLSPLRCHRSKHKRLDGHAFFDQDLFQPKLFLRRISQRIRQLGLADLPMQNDLVEQARCGKRKLVWLDVSYGPKSRRKSLGGCVGEVQLESLSPELVSALVWGQYSRVGEATRFGLGRYRIVQLGEEPFPCHRATGLLTECFATPRLDQLGIELRVPSGELRNASRQIVNNGYEIEPHVRLKIPKSDGISSRTLAIPSRRDRALQRAVMERIAPAVDMLLEESSLAYRRGLGRNQAAYRINRAFKEGYQWALKADFKDFFDSVCHIELSARISAYLGDDELSDLIMRWVRAGAPRHDRGLPTGSPLSPLLANLLLDEFDERISKTGARLVRYADDFVILFRKYEDAQAVFESALNAAETLRLELNSNKTSYVSLDSPFEFLGFRFFPRDEWEVDAVHCPQSVADLGWEVRKRRRASDKLPRLSGESTIEGADTATILAGPGVRRLNRQGQKLIVEFDDQRPPKSVPLTSIEDLVLFDTPNISSQAVQGLTDSGIRTQFVDRWGRVQASLIPDEAWGHPEALLSQAAITRDSDRRLVIAKALVTAKLCNYADLAQSYPGRRHDRHTAKKLRELVTSAERMQAVSQLLGVEGSGAATWYGTFADRLPKDHVFTGRVKPLAEDPVNIMLNIGQTILHRHLVWVIRQHGLSPMIGLLHQTRSGHAAFASDMQEAFRHLVDRAVLEAAKEIRSTDFVSDPDGKYALRIRPHALKILLKTLYLVFACSCHGKAQSSPAPYRLQWHRQLRSFKRHLLDDRNPFQPFEHP